MAETPPTQNAYQRSSGQFLFLYKRREQQAEGFGRICPKGIVKKTHTHLPTSSIATEVRSRLRLLASRNQAHTKPAAVAVERRYEPNGNHAA